MKALTCNMKELIDRAKSVKPAYQATSFWKAGVPLITNDLEQYGMSSFRRWPNSLGFFVPTYGPPGNSLTPEINRNLMGIYAQNKLNRKQKQFLEQCMNGELQAENDYRVLKSSVIHTENDFLLKFSESNIGNPIEQLVIDNKIFSRSSLNYLMGLAALGKFTPLRNLKNILEIGGGFGTLGEIVNQLWCPQSKYLNLDIPPICNIAEYYLQNVCHDFYGIDELLAIENIRFSSLRKINVSSNWKIEDISGEIDLFVNMISFQEMERDVVINYLHFIKNLKPKFLLFRHILEGKQKKTIKNSIGVIEPTTPDIYKDNLANYKLLHRDSLPYGFNTPDKFHSQVLIFRLD